MLSDGDFRIASTYRPLGLNSGRVTWSSSSLVGRLADTRASAVLSLEPRTMPAFVKSTGTIVVPRSRLAVNKTTAKKQTHATRAAAQIEALRLRFALRSAPSISASRRVTDLLKICKARRAVPDVLPSWIVPADSAFTECLNGFGRRAAHSLRVWKRVEQDLFYWVIVLQVFSGHAIPFGGRASRPEADV